MTITFKIMQYGSLLLLMLSTLGCMCHQGPSCKHGSSWCTNPGNPCHGYYSTCWREWPCECERCPPYTLGLLEGAAILHQDGQEPLPPGQVQPLFSEPPPSAIPETQRPSVPHRPAGNIQTPPAGAALPVIQPQIAAVQPEVSSPAEIMHLTSEQPQGDSNNLRDEGRSQAKAIKPMFSNATFKAAPKHHR